MRNELSIGGIVAILAIGGVASADPTPPVRPGPTRGAPSVVQEGIASSHQVTWGYLKMSSPGLVVSLLKRAAAGKFPTSSFATLGSAQTRQQLLAAQWPSKLAPANTGLGPAPKGQTRAEAAAAKPSAWGSLVKMITTPPDHSPQSLAFADAWDKQVKVGTVWFTANADGHVAATVPTGAPFRIRQITSFDGTLGGGGIKNIVPAPWDWRRVAPFELSVRAGQEFSVTVEFAPQFQLGTMMAGQKTGTLEVKGDTWTAKVPMSGVFNGINLAGILITPQEDEITIPTWYPMSNVAVGTSVSLLNIGGDARTFTITGDSMPTGVTLEGGSKVVSLAGGESKIVPIRFLLNSAQYGYAEPISLKATAPGGFTSSAYLSLNVVPDMRDWEFEHTDLSVHYRLIYTIFPDGNFTFYRDVDNGALIARHFSFTCALDGTEFGAFSGSVDSVYGTPYDIYEYGFVRPQFHDDYARWTRATAKFSAQVWQ